MHSRDILGNRKVGAHITAILSQSAEDAELAQLLSGCFGQFGLHFGFDKVRDQAIDAASEEKYLLHQR